jgi:putative cell wall-binding protein
LHHAVRALALALVIAVLAVAPVAATATPAGTGTTPAVSPAAPALSSAKVVIIVGATHGETSHYRDIADSAYAEAIKWSSNVVKVYSPNATWAAVKSAVQGANVVLYLGHGNGWPSPYTYDPNFTTKDGFGLNASAGNGDYNNTYYGEPYIATLGLAPNAVVLLNHLCYASGNSEPGQAAPTQSVAMQRVDNYGSAFIKAGARAVIAEGHGSVNGMIRDLFSTHQTVVDLWRGQSDYHGNELSFQSSRSPGYTAFMDPESDGGYYRSLVGSPNVRTEDVTGVPYTPTDPTPDTLGPQLWGVDGNRTISPNGDGVTDTLALTLRFSEEVTWSVEVRDGWTVKWQAQGVGAEAGLSWDATSAGAVVADGDYTLAIHAEDEWGNEELDSHVLVTIDTAAVYRLAGSDRFSTAAAISAATFAPGVPVAYIATGYNFPDALAGAAVAGSQGAPILLVTTDSIPPATAAELTRLQPARIVILGSTGVVSSGVEAAANSYTTGGVTRLAGADRYATAAAISAANFSPGVAVAYVATGSNFPDALAGAAAAGSRGAPILLVTRDSIPGATAAELSRLQPGGIVVLGAAGVVSDGVLSALTAYTIGPVSRLAGADRYATAATISAATFAPGVPVAYIATGLNFPDALAGAAVAGSKGAPILLVRPDSLPGATAAELARLQPGMIVILGGTGVVNESVRTQLRAYAGG